MIHFVPTGVSIGADHLKYLIDYFDQNCLEHKVHDGMVGPEDIEEGHAYVSCDMNMDYNLAPVKHRIFQVQLPHNLTGLKGSDLSKSQANLNLLGGRQAAEAMKINLYDSRYAIRGYAKWDVIYPERFLQDKRREEIAAETGMNPEIPWVCFYPTGPNQYCRGNHYRTPLIYRHLKKDLGELEFVFCNHARNKADREAKREVQYLKCIARKDPKIHIIDGGETLRHIAACNLFITDIASTVVTAMSMVKPVVFIAIEHEIRSNRVERFQCGVFFEQVNDFEEFIRIYKPTRAVKNLFSRCVEYDDDRNCKRISETILAKYEGWRRKSGVSFHRKHPEPTTRRKVNTQKQHMFKGTTIAFSGHNVRDFCVLALRSFLHHYPNLRRQIVFFDDASDDGTCEWIKQNGIRTITWKHFDSRANEKYAISYRVNLIILEILKQIEDRYVLISDSDVVFHCGGFLEDYRRRIEGRALLCLEQIVYAGANIKDWSGIEKYRLLWYDDGSMAGVRRICQNHMFIDLWTLKHRGILYDRTDNHNYNLWLGRGLDSGVDFLYQLIRAGLEYDRHKEEDITRIISHIGFVSCYVRNSAMCRDRQKRNVIAKRLRQVLEKSELAREIVQEEKLTFGKELRSYS